MRRGLFGKLQSKRDFIAPGISREFLAAWEPWIQSAVASSRMTLGEDWLKFYLTAPIWRFWLGPENCGAVAIGAVMSSIDGVGRYFPLTLVFLAEPGDQLAPPELDPQDDWFNGIEHFLLATLDADRCFEEVIAALATLPPPRAFANPCRPLALSPCGSVLVPAVDGDFAESFGAARIAHPNRAYAASTFWWTAGGSNYPRFALASHRMPDPSLFAGMISGRFEREPQAELKTSGK